MPTRVLWTALLVVGLVAASSVWFLTRPSGSDTAGPVATDSPAQAGATEPGGGAAAGTVVSLTFNFGTVSQYDHARPLLRRHGVHGTFYVTPDRLDAGEGCCMSWQQARQLYREGDEIGSFSADGVDLTVPWSADPSEDYARKEEEVCAAHERLVRLGLDPQSFAYPAGAHTYDFPTLDRSLSDLVASCGYTSGRIIGGLSTDAAVSPVSSVALPPSDPYALPTPAETSTAPVTLADLQQAVVAGSGAAGHLVPLVFGEVCHAGAPSYAACMATRRPVEDTVLSDFLSWLAASGQPGGAPAGTTVQTVREVMGAQPPPPLPPPATIVSFTFDDGDLTQDLAGRILRDHGMQGTFYINTGRTDAEDPYHMSWDQVLRLHRDGNDIGGHTASHINLTDPAIPDPVKRDEVCRDHVRLQQMGLDPQSFAYPYGGLDEAAQALVQSCGYASGRSAGSVSPDGPVFAETVPPLNPFATMALDGPGGAAVEDPSTTAPAIPLTLDYLQRAVVSASDNGGGWVQVVLHHVCVSDAPDLATCMASEAPIEASTFSAFLDWLQHDAPDGTTVRTVREVMEDTA
ncbi:polysaccharide deacetylase family protein [Geodermatophilus maliterrae]|uniref:Polysaccharide deacetylase family protein n=1 Tax=Geodermatophilus maliterrae TaxID=3162531 RepID=A0ABV3XFQ8_9ACTN